MKSWLVIDVSYLCHRAFHTTKDLSWKGKATGVIFGFLKSIGSLKDDFQTDRIAFCFEHPHLFRREVYPDYKRKRNSVERSPEERESLNDLAIQISELRNRYLPMIGFKNIFCFRGFESDDTMAAIAQNVPDDEEVILVTADHDLFQCLKENVMIYSPQARKIITHVSFTQTYGIVPPRWAVVKAIAGCTSDEVRGIAGVGEITAIRYLRKELKLGSKAYQSILSQEGRAIVRRNRTLVELPYKGCPVPTLQEDQVSVKGWREVCGMLGMRSIAKSPPVATRTLGLRR